MSPNRTELMQNTEAVGFIPVLQIPRNGKGRMRWAIVKKWTPEMQAAAMESEAKVMIKGGIELTDQGLKRAHLSGFEVGVSKYYPGGLISLQEKIGIVPTQKPSGFWNNTQNIELEAQRLHLAGNNLSLRSLTDAGMSGLSVAISKYYPGGIRKLRENLGSPALSLPRGYWENPENIEAEGRKVLQAKEQLTQATLRKRKLSSMVASVAKNYPGGMRGLKQKLGTPVESRPNGYWQDPGNIEMEARRILELEGPLSQKVITKHEMSSLNVAISKHYPGGMRALKEKLGVPEKYKHVGYWTPQIVEQAAREFYQEHGSLTQRLLDQEGRNDLNGAIALHYPGKMVQLKRNLGIVGRKPRGYWTEETILQRAREFLKVYGVLSHEQMKTKRASDLSTAILKFFPGKTKRLMEVLGLELTGESPIVVITPDEANEGLRRLL